MLAAFVLFATPLFSRTEDISIQKADSGYMLQTEKELRPVKGHYMQADIKAVNTVRGNFPYGTAFIKWEAGPDENIGAGQENFKIYIDGNTHSYHIPLGLNMGWTGSYPVDNVILTLPQFEGVAIEVQKVSLKERIFFPVDIYLLGLLDNSVIPAYANINRFLIPSYIFLLLILFLAGIYYLIFRKHPLKGMEPGKTVKTVVFISILIILLLYSGTYIYGEVLAVKSHWTAYGDDLLSGNIKDTYLGIYDFEKFIIWTNEIIPEGKPIIVLVKGEPVYIMSEMAYNMYPRDIKFLDISGKTGDDIAAEIDAIRRASGKKYEYLIVLSEDDSRLASGYELTYRYRSTGGYIYNLIK